jgi:hypothetical protein
VNARDNTPLRTLIADRLAAGEDTAAGIASAIGKGDTPSIVVKELNAMRTDGQVECEQRGNKKELVYWLAVPRDVAAASAEPEVAKNTGSSASGSLSPAEGAAVQPKTAPVAAATPSAAPGAADVKPPQYDPRSVAFSASTRLEAEKDEEYSLLGLLADIRAAVGDPEGKLMQDELVEHIRAIYDLGEAHKRACLAWEGAMMAAVGEDGVNDALKKIVDLQNKICMQDAELFKQSGAVVELRNLLAEERAVRMALQEQLEAMQREAMRGASLLSGSDRYTAAGYLVRASKRKPRALQAADKAREAALGAIRAGAARAEVFALVPIGHARRGAEWRSA